MAEAPPVPVFTGSPGTTRRRCWPRGRRCVSGRGRTGPSRGPCCCWRSRSLGHADPEVGRRFQGTGVAGGADPADRVGGVPAQAAVPLVVKGGVPETWTLRG